MEGLGCGVDGEPASGALKAQALAVWDLGRVGEQPVCLACDVALEAADDLASGLALGSAARGVVDAALVEAQACGCRKLCRGWSGGISVLVDESVTAGRSQDLEVSIWLVWWVGGDGWLLVE